MSEPDQPAAHAGHDDDRVEQYLTGRLGAAEAAELEEHYLACQACLDELEIAARMLGGLRQAAGEDAARLVAAGAVARRARLGRGARITLAAALLAVALVPTGLLLGRLDERDARLAHLETQLAEAHAPQGNTLLLDLSPHRGATLSAPVHLVRLGLQTTWVTVTLQLDRVAHPSYRATLLAPDGSVAWQGDGLVASYTDSLAISVHRSQLDAGDYRLEVEGVGAAVATSVASFRFRVERVPGS